MEKIHDRVINSIHAALSDESLVQILAPPFNETLAAATKVYSNDNLDLLLHPPRSTGKVAWMHAHDFKSTMVEKWLIP